MQKLIINFPGVKLAGISERTNNANEADPSRAKIGPTVQKYMQENIPTKLHDRVRPNVNFCAYTDYQAEKITDPTKCDYNGDYTFFIGEAVGSFENTPSDLKTLTIPAGRYARFTTPQGAMPAIVINAWMEIWNMTSEELGGERNYITDFEVYDENAIDLNNAIVNLYIGIK